MLRYRVEFRLATRLANGLINFVLAAERVILTVHLRRLISVDNRLRFRAFFILRKKSSRRTLNLTLRAHAGISIKGCRNHQHVPRHTPYVRVCVSR